MNKNIYMEARMSVLASSLCTGNVSLPGRPLNYVNLVLYP